jgi:hypothetical protein
MRIFPAWKSRPESVVYKGATILRQDERGSGKERTGPGSAYVTCSRPQPSSSSSSTINLLWPAVVCSSRDVSHIGVVQNRNNRNNSIILNNNSR